MLDIHVPYNDGLLEARESNHPGWVAIDWLYPGKEPFKTGRTFFRLDKALEEAGFKGWLMWSDVTHKRMHIHLMRAGGYPYAIDKEKIYFRKQFLRSN